MKTIHIWVMLFCGVSYGDAVIFSGSDVKALKSNIQLFDKAKIMSGTVNPSSTATSANMGSIYLNTADSLVYRKTDNGLSTNWASYISYNLPSQVDLINCSVQASVATSALTVALKTSSGADASGGSPCTISFRSSTPSTGTFAQVALASAASVVVSNGSSLGGYGNQSIVVFVYAINNAGSIELAVSSKLHRQDDPVTTLAEGGAGGADTRGMYSTTARAGVSHRLIGAININQGGSNAWTNAPTKVAVWPFDIQAPRARAVESAGTVVVSRSAFSTLNYQSVDYDNYSMYSTSGVFTVPWDGRYALFGQAQVTAINAGSHCIMRIIYNGGTKKHLSGNFRHGTITGAGKCHGSISHSMVLSAGDTIEFQMTFDDAAANRNLINNSDFNSAEVTWIGF